MPSSNFLTVPFVATFFVWLIRLGIAKSRKKNAPMSYYGSSELAALAVSVLITAAVRFGVYSSESEIAFLFLILALFMVDTRIQLGKHARSLNRSNKDEWLHEYPDYSPTELLIGAVLGVAVTFMMLYVEGSLRF